MEYYFSKKIRATFEEAENKIIAELKNVGFGILTEIDVKETLKKKLNADFRKYKILGACNPNYAFEALKLEDKIGVLLPCSVIIQETDNSDYMEIAIMNPIPAMKILGNPELENYAQQVANKLKSAIDKV